jgi:hypothetical protein
MGTPDSVDKYRGIQISALRGSPVTPIEEH